MSRQFGCAAQAEICLPFRRSGRAKGFVRYPGQGLLKFHVVSLGNDAVDQVRLRHSPEMIRVCSPELTRRPGWARDDNALPTYGLRAKVRRMGWATLTERKWVFSGERRGRDDSAAPLGYTYIFGGMGINSQFGVTRDTVYQYMARAEQ